MAFQARFSSFTACRPPDAVEEGKRIFQTHAPWMEATHHRDGEKALLTYNVAVAPQLSNLLDPNSAPTASPRLSFTLGSRM